VAVPRRILLLITDLEIGGTPTVVRELAGRLHRPAEGVHVEVACLSAWGPVADQIKAAGVEVTALGARRAFQFPGVVRRLRRLVRERQIDTVFSFLLHANAVAAAASCALPGVRFLQSIQTTQPNPRWHWRLQRLVHRGSEYVVVPSQSAADVARQWSNIPVEKLIVIPNAVDPDAFAQSSVALRDPRPYPIGFIGRLDAIKRVDRLVDDVAVLEVTAPGLVHLHIFGDGPERGRIEASIDRARMRHAVTMHGAAARPQEALSELGLLLLRSDAEGFGLVLIEAMAAGVPVLANDVPGIRDVVRSNETGLLVHPGSPIEGVFAIRRVVEDRAFRDRLIRNGLTEVRERFSWGNVVPAYRQLLAMSHD
jgi:glycosyltransferase involved in cell wall biosynthesis